MKTQQLPPLLRPTKDKVLRFRCSDGLRSRLLRMAAFKEKDYSDLLREAADDVLTKFEQTLRLA